MSKNIPSVTSDGGTSDGGPSVRTNGNAPSAPSSNTSTSQPVSYSAVNYADHFEGVGASYGLMRGNYVAEETHGVGANNQVLKNYGAQVYNLSDLPNVQGGANYSNYMRPDWVSNSSAEQIESLNNSQLHWNISGVDLNAEIERDPNDNGLQSSRTFTTDDAYAARAKRMGEDLPENRYSTYEDPYVTRAKRLKQDPETNQIYDDQGFNLTPEKISDAFLAYKSFDKGIAGIDKVGDYYSTLTSEGEGLTNIGEAAFDQVLSKAGTLDSTLAEYGAGDLFGEGGLTALAEGGLGTLAEVGIDAAAVGGFLAGGEIIAGAALVGFGLYEGYKALGGTQFGSEVGSYFDKAKTGLGAYDSFVSGLF